MSPPKAPGTQGSRSCPLLERRYYDYIWAVEERRTLHRKRDNYETKYEAVLQSLTHAGLCPRWVDRDVIPLANELRIEADKLARTSLVSKSRRIRLERTRVPVVDSVPSLRRLTRRTIHHAFLNEEKGTVIVFEAGSINTYAVADGCQVSRSEIVGSRPLVVASSPQATVYGEYTRESRPALAVMASLDGGASFSKEQEIAGIRHIHGIQFDPFTGWFWVTTGDKNHESALWVMESLDSKPRRFYSCGQRSRAVSLVFTRERVFWGTDSPDEANCFVSINRKDLAVDVIGPAAGPVYYSGVVGKKGIFTTAVEPDTYTASVIYLLDLDTLSLERLGELPKDRLPMIFQYGTVLVSGSGRQLSLRLRGVSGSGSSIVISDSSV